MVDAGVNSNGINNTVPTYVDIMNYFETIDGNTTTYLTTHEVKAFYEVVMGLALKHISALRDKGITHPNDLADFDSDDYEAII